MSALMERFNDSPEDVYRFVEVVEEGIVLEKAGSPCSRSVAETVAVPLKSQEKLHLMTRIIISDEFRRLRFLYQPVCRATRQHVAQLHVPLRHISPQSH